MLQQGQLTMLWLALHVTHAAAVLTGHTLAGAAARASSWPAKADVGHKAENKVYAGLHALSFIGPICYRWAKKHSLHASHCHALLLPASGSTSDELQYG